MDSRGSSTLEISLVLIFILIVAGAILSFEETATHKIIKVQENDNVESLLSEIVDNLINNPGNPSDWQKNKKGTPGLAIVNEEGNIIPNSVSYVKLLALGSDYKKLVTQRIFNSNLKSSIELVPHESSISSVKIGQKTDGKNIYSVNRLVKCDFYKKYVVKDFQYGGKCNHNHKQKSYSCNYFKVFKGNLRSSNYYLLIDSDEKNNMKYRIDTTRVVKLGAWQKVTVDKIPINDKINFYDDTSAIVFVHFNRANAKAVLVSVPKSFDRNKLEYDYFRTNDCDFILKAWY